MWTTKPRVPPALAACVAWSPILTVVPRSAAVPPAPRIQQAALTPWALPSLKAQDVVALVPVHLPRHSAFFSPQARPATPDPNPRENATRHRLHRCARACQQVFGAAYGAGSCGAVCTHARVRQYASLLRLPQFFRLTAKVWVGVPDVRGSIQTRIIRITHPIIDLRS